MEGMDLDGEIAKLMLERKRKQEEMAAIEASAQQEGPSMAKRAVLGFAGALGNHLSGGNNPTGVLDKIDAQTAAAQKGSREARVKALSSDQETIKALTDLQKIRISEKGLQQRHDSQMALLRSREAKEAAKSAPLTDAQKLGKLNSSDKQRFDNVEMANKAVGDMFSALQGGQSRFSLIGDNDYTSALTRFEEAIGRMQSGGAINKEEGERFKGLARSFGDSPEMQVKKLAELRNMMRDRYTTLGFDPAAKPEYADNISFEALTKSKPKAGGIPNANAGDDQITPEDLEALAWAKQNAADPRAAGIRAALRQKGL